MRRGTKVQILDRNHRWYLAYGWFIKNKRGGKVLIKVKDSEIEIPKTSIEEV